MTTGIEPQTINKYLVDIQGLKIKALQDPSAQQNLLNFILQQKEVFEGTPENLTFFKGEYAFHSDKYEQALAQYMQARAIPEFEFFCYRATAFVSFSRGDSEKALSFINKTLDLHPDDYATLQLQKEIYLETGHPTKAEEIEEKLQEIAREHEVDSQQESTPHFGKKEVEELSTIFEKAPEKEELFSQAITTEEAPSPSHLVATKLGVDLSAEKALEDKIQSFQKLQSNLIQQYFAQSQEKRDLKDHALFILNGWKEPNQPSPSLTQLLLSQYSQKNTGGFFLRWNGKGIVINPGSNFLSHFHSQGLYLTDIHHVIVTRDHSESHADIKKLYDLNYQLNKINPELHVIHYYLNHKAYQKLSQVLKPNFKQERNTVHSLELFLDSPDVEKEEIAPGITLNYFCPSTQSENFKGKPKSGESHALGIRLDLKNEHSLSDSSPTRLGYISGTTWSPLLAHHLGNCDLLIAGFGQTNPNDYGKLSYHDTSLGYFGSYTLLEEIKPKLFLCTEFEGSEGDIRLEVTKKLRKEYQVSNAKEESQPVILPADNGLFIDLTTLHIECSVTKHLLATNSVRVMKTSETFGPLRYLSEDCIL